MKDRKSRFSGAHSTSLKAATVLGALAVIGGSLAVAIASATSTGSKGSGSNSYGGLAHHSVRGSVTALPRMPRTVVDSSNADGLPDDCVPNSAGPPTSPYQLGLVGTINDGSLVTGPASVSNINATFCSVVTVVQGNAQCPASSQVTAQPDDQVFGNLQVALNLVPGMTPTIKFTPNPGPIVGTTSCASSVNGLAVTLDATVGGSTGPLFGVSCSIGPFTIPLTGRITGPFTHLTGTLTNSTFSVPAIQQSPDCPGAIPENIDEIAGLPLGPGQSTASLPVTASLYQPATG
ncbi:MAG TPA: hypothetical protein VEJ87_10070 [Acidimicrobiales bacterium]|nr:hypothetical protein [Acidimicrobiales bacterium]